MRKWYVISYYASISTMWILIAFLGVFAYTTNMSYISSVTFYAIFILFFLLTIIYFLLFLKLDKQNAFDFIKEQKYGIILSAVVNFMLTQFVIIKSYNYLIFTIPFSLFAAILSKRQRSMKYINQ